MSWYDDLIAKSKSEIIDVIFSPHHGMHSLSDQRKEIVRKDLMKLSKDTLTLIALYTERQH